MYSQFRVSIPRMAFRGADADIQPERDLFELHPLQEKFTDVRLTRRKCALGESKAVPTLRLFSRVSPLEDDAACARRWH